MCIFKRLFLCMCIAWQFVVNDVESTFNTYLWAKRGGGQKTTEKAQVFMNS